jgi:hypothetical protein
MLPQHDIKAYLTVIAALESDLARSEQQVAATKLLIGQLRERAGLKGKEAGSGKGSGKGSSGGAKSKPPEEKDATLAELGVSKRQSEALKQGSRPGKLPTRETKGRGKIASGKLPTATKGQALDKAPAPAKPDLTTAVAEWQKILAARAEAIAQAEAAARDKDPAKLKAAIAARARLELRLGEILTIIDGRIRPLPGGTDRNARERWKLLTQQSAPEFENGLRRWQHRALAAIGVRTEKPAPAKAKPTTRPKQAMRISDWQHDPSDGALTRTLTAVDDDGAAAAASGG